MCGAVSSFHRLIFLKDTNNVTGQTRCPRRQDLSAFASPVSGLRRENRQTWFPRECSLVELSIGVTPPPVRLGPLFELAADPRPLMAVRKHPYVACLAVALAKAGRPVQTLRLPAAAPRATLSLVTRGLQVLLCLLLLVLTGSPALAHCRPENRVWVFLEKSPDFASKETAKPIDTPSENPGYGYDFASGVHKYLYCEANPANMVDPSGHDGDLASLEIATSIGAGLDAMYNGGVLTVYNALRATINGIQANESAQQILTGYLVDTAIGVGVGVAVGVAAKLSGDLIYGTSLARTACFVAGTPVATESGERPIEQIKKGDQVWSWNEETEEFCLEKVASTHVRQVSEEVVIQTGDEAITTTLTHPFRVKDKGWVEAGDLQPGDCLVALSGQTETITRTTTTNFVALVFNFEVENTHTYLVGAQPVVVHNACAWATRSASIPSGPGIYIIRASTGERYVGQAKDLAGRLTSSSHDFAKLIRDPNSEVFTMSLDVAKVKGSTSDALHAAEDFYIKALGAKRTSANATGLNSRFQRNSDWMNNYFNQNGFPPLGDPIAH